MVNVPKAILITLAVLTGDVVVAHACLPFVNDPDISTLLKSTIIMSLAVSGIGMTAYGYETYHQVRVIVEQRQTRKKQVQFAQQARYAWR